MSKTEKMEVPLKYYERNVLFLKDKNKAVYKYEMEPYPYMSEDQKKAILSTLHDFFWVYRGKGKILLSNRLLTEEELLDAIDDLQQENPFPKTYAKWKEDMRLELEFRQPWTQVLYFILDIPSKKLPSSQKVDVTKAFSKNGAKLFAKELLSSVSSAGMQAVGLASKDIEEHEVEQAFTDEEILYNTFRMAGNISKAAPSDIEYILRAPFYREMGRVPISMRSKVPAMKMRKDTKTYIRPHKAFILDLFDDAWIDPDWKHLSIHHGKEEGLSSYQSHLVLTGIPDHISPLHNEWLHWILNLDFPVDVCINFEIKGPDTEIKKVRQKQHDMRGEIDTLEEKDMNVSSLDIDNLDKGDELERKLSEGQPLMEFELVLAVAGQNEKIMDERVEAVKKMFAPRMFDFSVVPSKQEQCFLKFFPWGEADAYWCFPVDPGFISSAGIHCTTELGTKEGPWLGSTWSGKPILADFGWPMRNNRAGTIVLLGSMGGGKSATMKKIIKTILLLGGYVFIIDPKDEFHVLENNEEFAPHIKVIKFGAGMSSTRINIFMTSTNKDRAWQTAKGYLSLILNAKKSEGRTLVINKVVKNTMQYDKPNMLLFIEELKKYQNAESDLEMKREAKLLLDLLDGYQEDPLAKIVFHDETEDLNLDQYRAVVANLKGLKLPKKGMDFNQIDDTMKLSLGVVLLIANIGRELMQHRPNDVLKAFGADEYWILESDELQDLNKELVKMSRSQYVVPVFATQEPADVKTPDVRNNLGWVLCGKMESKQEIDDAMTMLGIEDASEDIYMQFRKLESGQFFVRDPLGRKDVISIYQPEDWLELFKTTPEPKKKEAV